MKYMTKTALPSHRPTIIKAGLKYPNKAQCSYYNLTVFKRENKGRFKKMDLADFTTLCFFYVFYYSRHLEPYL